MHTPLFLLPSLLSSILAHPTPSLPAQEISSPVLQRRSKVLTSRSFTTNNLYQNWPSYDQLPLETGHPFKAAWGVWGAKDELGALNHITNATILTAREEIKIGRGINLNLDLSYFPTPLNTDRKPTVHEFKSQPGYMDDIVNINTQAGTQYDGLRHFPYSTGGNTTTYQYYNDLLDYEDITGPQKTTTLGIQNASKKGIVGRGILLDFARFAAAHNITYNPFSNFAISLDHLLGTIQFQNLTESSFLPGDILLIRSGWTQAYNDLSKIEKGSLPWQDNSDRSDAGNIGVEPSPQMAEWLWNRKLSLVGGDAPAFEVLPLAGNNGGPTGVNSQEGEGGISLHKVFIAGWGQSIMEFLDLEELSELLHGLGRSTFFMTVQNLVVDGGVASPPNAMAIV